MSTVSLFRKPRAVCGGGSYLSPMCETPEEPQSRSSLVCTLLSGESGSRNFRERMISETLSTHSPSFQTASLDRPSSPKSIAAIHTQLRLDTTLPAPQKSYLCPTETGPELDPRPSTHKSLILGESFNLFEPHALSVGL